MRLFSNLVDKSKNASASAKLKVGALAACCALAGAAYADSFKTTPSETSSFSTFTFADVRAQADNAANISEDERSRLKSILSMDLGFRVYTTRGVFDEYDVRDMADAQINDEDLAREMMEAQIREFELGMEDEQAEFMEMLREEERLHEERLSKDLMSAEKGDVPQIKAQHNLDLASMRERHTAEIAAFEEGKAKEVELYGAQMRDGFSARMEEMRQVRDQLDKLDDFEA